MKSTKNFKIAVLGTGSIGRRHLRILNEIGVSTIAVPARKERLFELKKDGFKTATTLEEAKRMGAVGVIICTDTGRHINDCLTALNLDLLVLCEKPLATSKEEALKIESLISGNLFVGYNLRYDSGFQTLFNIKSEIGEFFYIYSECRSYLPEWRKNVNYLESYSARENEGGVILDLSHEIDYLCYFYGIPENVFGVRRNFGILGIKGEEFASAIFDYKDSLAVVTIDYISRNPVRRCILSAKNGDATYDFLSAKLIINHEGKEEIMEFKRKPDELYRKELEEFIGILNGGRRQFLGTYEESLNVLKVIDDWKKLHREKHDNS
jgi:predicted dehydrogenase